MRTDNNIFCWNRFGALTLNMLREERKTMVLFTIFVGVILFFLPLSLIYIDKVFNWEISSFFSEKTYYSVFSVLIVFTSILVKGNSWLPDVKDRRKAEAFLSLPASTFEKVFSRYLLFSLGLFIFASFVCGFFSVFSLMLLKIQVFPIYTDIGIKWYELPFLFLFLQVFFIIGGLYFKKHSFLKTILFITLFHIICYGLFSLLFSGNFFICMKQGYFVESICDNINCIIFYIISLFIIYFKVKELEIDEI